MPKTVPGARIFEIDWCDKDQVIQLAKAFGVGQIVIKYPTRFNYNISHSDRKDYHISQGADVIFET